YYSAMDRDSYSNIAPPLPVNEAGESSSGSSGGYGIEKPLLSIREIGQTVTEGRAGGGNLLNTMQAAIWKGAGKIELSLQGEGSEPFVGPEAYGKEMREDIRQLAKINDVKIHSVHSPTWVGNLSGYAGKQQGFSDEYRAMQLEEVKKAIDFSADTTGGSAIVVHTGEYERPLVEQPWNKGEFRQYEEEEKSALYPLIDKRTGHIVQMIRKDLPIIIPKWKTAENDYVDSKGNKVLKDDFTDYDNNKVNFMDRVPEFDPKSPEKIKMEQKSWKYFEEEARRRNEEIAKKKGKSVGELRAEEKVTPEEALYQSTQEGEQRFAQGWAMNYLEGLEDQFKLVEKLKKKREHFAELEKNTPEKEMWKIEMAEGGLDKFGISPEYKKPTEVIDKAIKEIQDRIRSSQEMASGQLQRAKDAELAKDNIVSSWKYAKDKSLNSYAELGIYAMQRTDEGRKRGLINDDIFIAPENLFPEMGYGSHPEELIELVKNARKKMVEHLTKPQIHDPSGALDESGKPLMINNPNYRNMSREDAEKEAKKHIKATLDTQHLGMWFRYFTPKAGETEEQRYKRFDGWYLDQVKKMEKEEIIGNVHIVDGFGKGHTHLPAGEGMLPVKSAVEYLKKKGYSGALSSEGYGEPGRQLTQTWAHFGSPIYALGTRVGAPEGGRWTDIEHSYFNSMQSPYFVFGAYAPSNDWTLWSGVPLE
ncbi:MAG: hypothetical protein NTV63_02865, partial [Candidatus Woesearchaeota archaeon]|nr:hypothetical protein [Candidatus Woesearchaeota archaeon]